MQLMLDRTKRLINEVGLELNLSSSDMVEIFFGRTLEEGLIVLANLAGFTKPKLKIALMRQVLMEKSVILESDLLQKTINSREGGRFLELQVAKKRLGRMKSHNRMKLP